MEYNSIITKSATRLGESVVLNGKMSFKKSLIIEGQFEGEIVADGFLYIDEKAKINADVKAKNIVIAGYVKGNIEAEEKIEMLPSGKIYGNVKAAQLRIADGVTFEGKCEMIRDPEDVDIFAAPINQLRKTITNG